MNNLKIYTADWCGDCKRTKYYLDQHHIKYEEINIEKIPEAAEIVKKINNGNETIPTLIFPDGTTLSEPTNEELEKKLASK